ncbi:McrC family protein [Xanthomonas sp. WHRI 8391]|uniref:McrC family protein n=1 Tax=Xanthomonas TaxID=338 RepID=UPI001A32BE6E|nr:McrC family protein [Xanthomonas hortorum]MBG3848933.1 hypothetical protein [Xanthomonas hortorum pv. carotae]UTS73974.1 McrC family protein [Xanthomonas hortorum]
METYFPRAAPTDMRTIKVKEYDEIEIPSDFLTASGELSAFPEILQRDYFSVRFKKGKPIFQAGGYIGTIPVNAKFSLEIIPKVPIANLERIVFFANYEPVILRKFKRRYSPHHYSSKALSEFLSDFFLRATEEVCMTGLLKLYQPRSSSGFSPKGRIGMTQTVRARAKFQDSRMVSTWHERTVDNSANRFLKHVLLRILDSKELMSSKKRKREVVELLDHFTMISTAREEDLLADQMIADHEQQIPSTKESYLDAISLGKIILQGKGFSFSSSGNIGASALILNLEKAFEGYVLAVLDHFDLESRGHRVLDGNKDGKFGGKKPLFSPSPRGIYINRPVVATPDILIKSGMENATSLVIDVKYKSIKNLADRSDLNQIISYALSYGSKHGVLVLPANEHCPSGLTCLGVIAGIEFFQYFMKLDAFDIEEEESALRQTILELLEMKLP